VELQRFINLAGKGKGSTILISGEAGSGKTRLAKEFLKKVKDNVTVLSGWCLSNTAIPYFPFIEAFDSYTTNTEQILTDTNKGLKLKQWLTRQQEDSENQNFRQAWKDQTYASITRELLLLSAQKPVVVFIDDIHWADSASLSLLQYLARAIAYERILLLATYRKEELNTQFDVSPQPFAEILRVMRREDLYNEVKLTGLSQREVGEVAKSMLGGDVSSKLIEKLTVESSGNPLFVIESLKFLVEQNGLVKENDCWITTNGQLGVPEKVKDVILRRLNTLTIEARDVLDAGSVIGDKFDAQLIGSVLNQSTVKVLSILNSISKSKSLVACENDWFSFDHPKTREVLYEEITLPLKKEYHLKIAETLEDRLGKGETSFGDLAYHYVNSSNKPKAIKYSLEAGKDALSRFSNTEAIKHFIYVLNVPEESSISTERATALEGLGDAYHANMMFQEAINTYKQLTDADCPTKVRALRKAMECAFFKNSLDQLQTFLIEAEACNTSDQLEKARILMNKARITPLGEGVPSKKIEYFETGLKLAEEEYSEWDVAWILVGLGSTRIWIGQQEKALAELLRAAKIFQDLVDHRWLIEANNAIGHTLTSHLGLRKEGMGFLRKAVQINDEAKVNDYLRLSQLNAYWGRALGIEEDFQGALSKSLEALSYAEKTDSGWGKGVVYANLTMFYSALGATKKTEEYYTKLTNLPSEVQHNSYVGTPVAKASYLASKNRWVEANAVFDILFAGLRSVSAPGVEANARISYAEILKKQGKNKQAKQQKKMAHNLLDDLNKRFEKTNVHANLMAHNRLSTDETLEMRIDITNVSKNKITLVSVTGFPSESQIKSILSGADVKGETIVLNNQVIEPFSVQSIKLSILFCKPGVYNLNPQVIYADKNGTSKTFISRAVQIYVASAPLQLVSNQELKPQKVYFKSETAERIYDFLIKAYQQDYTQRRMPKDRSGWRSLMDIVREAKVSRYGIYGFPNSQGQAMTELQHYKLVEIRVFEGERGRGGKITKARIIPEKLLYSS
jgi:tetratricopeptide (TPR) repeat protein